MVQKLTIVDLYFEEDAGLNNSAKNKGNAKKRKCKNKIPGNGV